MRHKGRDAGGKVDAGAPGPVAFDAGGVLPPAQGEVLITEVMYNPSGAEPDTEWFEVTNVASSPRYLNDLVLTDGASRTHTISSANAIVVAPGSFVLLVRSQASAVAAGVPAAAIVYEYGAGIAGTAGIALANGSTGAIALGDGATTIAQATYGSWYAASGASVQMKTPYAFASGVTKSAFCVSTSAWAAGTDLGTPGAPSDCN